MILFNELFFIYLLFLLKLNEIFYKQNLEWFDKNFKEFNVNDLEKIEGIIE